MTEKLRDLLHDRAADVDFPVPDLDVLVRAGERRARLRRAFVIGGSLAALAVAAAVVAAPLGTDDAATDPADGRAADALPVGVVSWVTGSVLHAGDMSADLGETIRAFVQTAMGYVVVDSEGHVTSVVEGSATEIGTVDSENPRLVADNDSTLVGWVDATDARPTFVVYDQDTTDIVLEDDSGTEAGMSNLADDSDPAYFYAIDGATAYWRDQRGAVAVGIGSGEISVIDPDARNGFDLIDVQDGVLAFYGDQGVEVGSSRGTARLLPQVMESSGVLSPGATMYAPDAEEARVDGVDGTSLPLAVPAEYFFSTVYEWTDDATVRVIALESEEASADILSCVVASGACELLVDGAGTEGELQLPVGEDLGG